MKKMQRFLIPGVRVSELSRLRIFSSYFKEMELDVFGTRKNDMGQLGMIKALVSEGGVGVYSIHLRGFNISGKDNDVAKRVVDFVSKLRSIFQPKVLVIHPGRGDMDSLLHNVENILSTIPKEVIFTVENMTDEQSIIYSPEMVRRLVARSDGLPENFGVCIDTTHPGFSEFHNSELYTPLLIDYLEAAHRRLKHLHFSDRREPSVDHPGKHIPIGSGIIEWGKVRDYLATKDYDGRAVIEVRGSEQDIIDSVCYYNGVTQKDLKINGNVLRMPTGLANKKVTREEILAIIEKRWGIPPKPLLKLLNLPEEAFIEHTENYIYFFVPSVVYGKDHIDPYYSLTGGEESVGWAHYLFGIRMESGAKLYALLIDRDRRIATVERIFSLYDKELKTDWAGFHDNIKKGLEAAKKYPKVNHIEVSIGGRFTIVDDFEEKAWK